MAVKEDITEQIFGHLKAIKIIKSINYATYWLCKCDCGNISMVTISNLKSGKTKTCGQSCVLRKRAVIHGMTNSKEYRIWRNIINRCTNPKIECYKDYGGRGIKVCDEWLNSFEKFINNVGKMPSDNLTIEKINNNGNYEPGNVRWATYYEQARNKRNNHIIEYNGEKMILKDWANYLGVAYKTLSAVVNRNAYSFDTIVAFYNNKNNGIKFRTIKNMLNAGLS